MLQVDVLGHLAQLHCVFFLLMFIDISLLTDSWQERVSEVRGHTFAPFLPEEAGGGSSKTSVPR